MFHFCPSWAHSPHALKHPQAHQSMNNLIKWLLTDFVAFAGVIAFCCALNFICVPDREGGAARERERERMQCQDRFAGQTVRLWIVFVQFGFVCRNTAIFRTQFLALSRTLDRPVHFTLLFRYIREPFRHLECSLFLSDDISGRRKRTTTGMSAAKRKLRRMCEKNVPKT